MLKKPGPRDDDDGDEEKSLAERDEEQADCRKQRAENCQPVCARTCGAARGPSSVHNPIHRLINPRTAPMETSLALKRCFRIDVQEWEDQ